MPLEPHHIFSVEPPTLFLKGLGGQILGLGSLHVVENEEQCFSGQPLEEVYCVTSGWRCLQEKNKMKINTTHT